MKLFFRKKNTASTKEVWRNAKGEITCPGDSCPKDCDDTCPVYLNTQAAFLIQSGLNNKAIEIYEKALLIAPDFYDAWNNLGGIYGGKGNYQKAYDCYKKAHDLNATRPNPVYGLILTSRDLGKLEECISWCDVYRTLSRDGRERAILDEVNRKLGKNAQSNFFNKY